MSEIENVAENQQEELRTEPGSLQEYVIIDGESYKAEEVITGRGSIAFVVAGLSAEEALGLFSHVKALQVAGEDLRPYGFYKNVTFSSATVDAAGMILVAFCVELPEETWRRQMNEHQAEQDAAIAEMMFGGGEE